MLLSPAISHRTWQPIPCPLHNAILQKLHASGVHVQVQADKITLRIGLSTACHQLACTQRDPMQLVRVYRMSSLDYPSPDAHGPTQFDIVS